MVSNFVNIFNQLTKIVNTSVRINQGQNSTNGNFANTSIFTNGTQAGSSVQNGRILPQFNLQSNTQIQQNQLINQQLQESLLQTQAALKEFTQEDKSILIKNLLSLPEDLTQLIKTIANKNENITNAEFMKLLALLNVNGKEAAAKLSKYMVFLGENGIKGAEKLQEIYSIINAMSSGATQSASQLMKNIILLYLPWLPIGESNNFEIGFKETVNEKKSSDSEDENTSADSDSISIFIQTVNYSNVKVNLYKDTGNKINMFVDCVENFPKEQLIDMVKGDSARLNLNTEMNFANTGNKNVEKNSEADFSVNVSKFINPYLMLMAQAVITAVISIDKHTTLIEKRKAG